MEKSMNVDEGWRVSCNKHENRIVEVIRSTNDNQSVGTTQGHFSKSKLKTPSDPIMYQVEDSWIRVILWHVVSGSVIDDAELIDH